ncbi:hypothetical protein [Stutzerimonas stutzeri]
MPIPIAWRWLNSSAMPGGALLRMKVGRSVTPLKIFLTQLERLLTPR